MDIALNHLVSQVNDIALAAGNEIMTIYDRDFDVAIKDDDSPVTEADLAAHEIIVASLRTITPDIPILSEEDSNINWQERFKWQTFWLVDPLDGTKEYIKRNGEFTVNIALIHNKQPVFGVVYAPVLDKLYFSDGESAFLTTKGETRQINANPMPTQTAVKVVGSRSHVSPEMDLYLKRFKNVEMVPVGSSLKFCLVAEGLADCYPRLGPTCWWDTAAGHAVAQAAGATVTQLDGSPLLYNHQESVLNPFFLVAKQ